MSFTELAGVQHASSDSSGAILLVEDDEGDAVLVQACLAEAGVPDDSIVWTRTLREALAHLDACRLESTAPACILVDLGLPDASGYGMVQTLVETVPDVAVIVLTGRQERDGAGALGVGAQDYLVKDAITAEVLERSMRYAAERKRAQFAQQQLLEARLSSSEQARMERGLLPNPMLRSDAVSCATYYQPGRDDAVLGGDFFDVVETPDGRVHAVIGDVMGHGPDEAALGVHLRVAWRTLLLAGVPDEQILPNLSALLDAEQADGLRFVTVCDVVIDDARATVRLAGHPAPIVAGSDGPHYPALAVGLPLGIPAGSVTSGADGWIANEIDLTPGASLVLYTDGLLEAYDFDPSSDGLGIDALVEAVGIGIASGVPSSSWISTLVSDAPLASVDDTAAVVLTTRR